MVWRNKKMANAPITLGKNTAHRVFPIPTFVIIKNSGIYPMRGGTAKVAMVA
jgi:hypothetical protein